MKGNLVNIKSGYSTLDINITEGRERLDYDYLEPLGRLIVQAKNSKILAKYV